MLKINCKGLTKTGSHKVIANMLCLWFKLHSDGDITGLLHQIPLSHSLDSLNTFISTSYFFLVLCENRPRVSLPPPSPAFKNHGCCSWKLIRVQIPCEVTLSIWVQVDGSSCPAPTLSPSRPACIGCNILIGRFLWRGRGDGRGSEYCDLTISCFVRSTFWSEDQLEAAINRKICSVKTRGKEGKAADVMIWKRPCKHFYTKPFF